jgi:uncharacterized protein (DUF1501 family)
MMRSTISRRGFIQGCSAAIAALSGARLGSVALAAEEGAEILVVVFLRGGCDVLNMLPPLGDADQAMYQRARPRLHIPTSGPDAALRLTDGLGMHPSMTALHELYQAKKLAVVQAAGLSNDTRSHFDAMTFMELGTPASKSTTNGWITRHLQSSPDLAETLVLPAIGLGHQPMALLNESRTVSLYQPSDLTLLGEPERATQRRLLGQMYSGDSWLHRAGTQTIAAVREMERAVLSDYAPANGARYPDHEFGYSLQTIAQMIKLNIGVRVATVDLGGWDTHEYQGDGGGGYLAELLGVLSAGLAALYTDLDGAHSGRVTVVTMSEFGRRLSENGAAGTDHGHGSAMLVLGGSVNGGAVYGEWPGLQPEHLYDFADLAVSTDYRRVLSEIVSRRLGNPHLDQVFPGYVGYEPLGMLG